DPSRSLRYSRASEGSRAGSNEKSTSLASVRVAVAAKVHRRVEAGVVRDASVCCVDGGAIVRPEMAVDAVGVLTTCRRAACRVMTVGARDTQVVVLAGLEGELGFGVRA